MSNFIVTERPELTSTQPAIDGIFQAAIPQRKAKNGGYGYYEAIPLKEPIRADVLAIIQKSDEDFDRWYKEREEALLGLLEPLKLAGDVPALYLSRGTSTIGQTLMMPKRLIEDLEQSLADLRTIKQVREEGMRGLD